jgi:molybdate transport system substrate-binding protein
MNYLADAGALETVGSVALLGNRLTLVTPRNRTAGIDLIAGAPLLEFLGDQRLAVGDPDHVPAGLYAKSALQSMGLWTAVHGKLVRSANVRAALVLVERGEVAAGIVYESDAKSSDNVRMSGFFPKASHPPIVYPASIIAGRTEPAIKRYLTYLRSEEAQRIFRAHGFLSRP